MNCGQCEHFEHSSHRNWGHCGVELPQWAYSCDDLPGNTVWVIEDHSNNYANECELFKKEKGE